MDEVGPRMAEEREILRVTQGTIEGMTETGEAADETFFRTTLIPAVIN
jgi:hypothetical protein